MYVYERLCVCCACVSSQLRYTLPHHDAVQSVVGPMPRVAPTFSGTHTDRFASIHFPVVGPNGTATMHVQASRPSAREAWTVHRSVLAVRTPSGRQLLPFHLPMQVGSAPPPPHRYTRRWLK